MVWLHGHEAEDKNYERLRFALEEIKKTSTYCRIRIFVWYELCGAPMRDYFCYRFSVICAQMGVYARKVAPPEPAGCYFDINEFEVPFVQ